MLETITPVPKGASVFPHNTPNPAGVVQPLSCWADDQAQYLQAIADAFNDYCYDLPEDYSSDSATSADETSSLNSEERTASTKCHQCKNCGFKELLEDGSKTSAKPKRGNCRKPTKGSIGGTKPRANPVSQVESVSRIEGPLMGLWPMRLEQLGLELEY